jgi:hypothetical protein
MVSITATGTIDEHVRDIKRRKAKNIRAIIKETKKKSQRALLKMFEIAKKNDELPGSDWEDETDLEDDVF